MVSEQMDLEKSSAEKAGEKTEVGKTAEGKKKSGKAAEGKKEPQVEAVYTVEEFAENSKNIFGTRKECVLAALKSSGITTCSVLRAKEIVSAFIKKEVK